MPGRIFCLLLLLGLASARAARLRTIAVTTTFPPEVVAGADAVVATLREVTAPLLASLVGGDAYRPREIGPS